MGFTVTGFRVQGLSFASGVCQGPFRCYRACGSFQDLHRFQQSLRTPETPAQIMTNNNNNNDNNNNNKASTDTRTLNAHRNMQFGRSQEKPVAAAAAPRRGGGKCAGCRTFRD